MEEPCSRCWNAAEYFPISWANPASSACAFALKGRANPLDKLAVLIRCSATVCLLPSSAMCARNLLESMQRPPLLDVREIEIYLEKLKNAAV